MPGDPSRALAASTDGVGTKVIIASELGRYATVGADLVNHCVNDILVVNADPLFFLDYLAVGKLNPNAAADIVAGIQSACQKHNCALLGGETAEMPDLYENEQFDLAGTIVGSVNVSTIPKRGKRLRGRRNYRFAFGGLAHERLYARAQARRQRRMGRSFR